MKKIFWVVLCLFNLNGAIAQSTNEIDSMGLQSLFDQVESFMDSTLLELKLDEELLSEFKKSLPEFDEMHLMWDSLSFQDLDLDELFNDMDDIELKEGKLDSMIKEGMQLFENIDLTELKKMIEDLNLEDLKLDYYFSNPQLPPEQKTDSIPDKSKSLKRI